MMLHERLLRPGRHWVLVSVAMYVIACVLPAMPPFNAENPIRGYVCLISVNGPFSLRLRTPLLVGEPELLCRGDRITVPMASHRSRVRHRGRAARDELRNDRVL